MDKTLFKPFIFFLILLIIFVLCTSCTTTQESNKEPEPRNNIESIKKAFENLKFPTP